MSVDLRVVGVKPPTGRWLEMKAIWDACEAAHVDPPDAVIKFFSDEEPDPAGVVVDVPTRAWRNDDECATGYEIDLGTLDPDVRILRAYIG